MKVLLVATVQSHICQFHKPLVEMLHEYGVEVHVAAKDNLAEKNGLQLDFVEKVFNIPFERSPFDKRNMKAYRQLKQLIERENYQVVHTNTPVGGIMGRLAARNARKHGCQVLYTAHGFHFFKGGPKKSWLLYFPVEWFMCRYTDELITITEEDFQLAKKRFPVSVSRTHGIGANSFRYSVATREEKRVLREQMGYSHDRKIIICTGELNANKNQIVAIEAMKHIVHRVPDALLLLAGNGETKEKLEEVISENGLEDNVQLLGYRTDLEWFVKAADLVLSCSKREGLPVNIIEGMLCAKPIVASINRGHKELVSANENGFLVDASDPETFAKQIVAILSDSRLSDSLGSKGLQKAQLYTDVSVKQELREIYQKREII